jgi:hypothetical protein
MKLRALLETSPAQITLHPVQTRDALIDFFRRHQVVRKIDIIRPATPRPSAA